MKKLYCSILIVGLLLYSCSLSKQNKNNNISKIETVREVSEKNNTENKPFDTFSCKIVGNYEGIPISATLRMTYDSIIWISASSLGLEGLRAICRTDSVFAINKIENEFIATTYDKITERLALPLSYGFIQSLFLDTTSNTKFNSPNLSGYIKKETIKVDSLHYFPSDIEINVIFNKHKQNIKLKVKNHKINPENTYPFSQP